MKKILYIFIGLILGLGLTASAATILFPTGGGTGLNTATAGDVGKCLVVSSNSPFTYTLGTCGSGSSFGWPFDISTNYGVNNAATSTPIWAQGGLNASSTSHFEYATGTALMLGNGSQTLAAVSVGNDADTGLYYAGTNSLGFTTNSSGFQWNGTALTPNTTDLKDFGSTSKWWRNLYSLYASTTAISATGGATFGGNVGIGTTSPYSKLSIWGGASGNIIEGVNNASTTVFAVSATGFGTTTVSGLNINGQATSTSNVGFNISTGCYAINGVCVGGGASSGASTTLLGDFNTWSNTNNFTGSVGIGTSTPFTQFQISTSTANGGFRPQLALSDYSAGANLKHWTLSSQGGNFYIASATDAYATSTTSFLTILSNGYVGIGTSNPSRTLSVNGPMSALSLSLNSGSSVTFGYGSSYSSVTGQGSSLLLATVGSTNSYISFQPANNERARIDVKGFFGLGTSTPFAQMQISTTTSSTGFRPQLALSDYAADTDKKHWAFSSLGGNLYVGTTTDAYATTTTSALSILSSGNVGIGQTAPGSLLSVAGGISAGSYSATAAPANGMIISGNVGVGSSSPYSKFSVHAQYGTNDSNTPLFSLASSTATATTTVFSIDTSGNASMNGTLSVYSGGSIKGQFYGNASGGVLNYSGILSFRSGGTQKSMMDSTGNLLIGTTSPASKLTVSNLPAGTGAVATTTVDFGDYATTTSLACFNTKNTAGAAISFYFVGTTMVVESSRCK